MTESYSTGLSNLRPALYSTDASMYQLAPLAVVTPRDREEALNALANARELHQPVLARGAGTSLTGQSIGEAVILDTSRYLNRILELNIDDGWVRVEPGVVCAELNSYLAPHGVHFAPDPATLDRACIGGMIASNAAGMRSVRYGMTIDHVVSLDLALAGGEVLSLGPLQSDQLEAKVAQLDYEGDLYRGVMNTITPLAAEIHERYPKVIRRSGGYALDALVDAQPFNLAKLICGSEGTLGVILEATLKLTLIPLHSALCLAHFNTLDAALRAAALVVEAGCSAAEMIDGVILEQARIHPLTREVASVLDGSPAAIQVIEVQGDDPAFVLDRINAIAKALKPLAYAAPVFTAQNDMRRVWELRRSALGLMTTVQGPRKPVPYIEDAAVPPDQLANYVADVLAVCASYGQPVSMFGHASVGLIHIRPLHDLHQPADIERLKQIQADVFQLVLKYGGSWSGEHGDGIVRGAYNQRFFGDAIYGGFRSIKHLFDPEGRMNPGKVLHTPPVDANLRYGPAYKPQAIDTAFHYRIAGGMVAAVEQCTGVASCRKTLAGVMCPSYMASRDEMQSTRARANALRLALSGQLGPEGLAAEGIQEVMDLCLGCKGCKGECPNSVDMTRLKAEVLHQQGLYRRSRSRFFTHQAALAAIAVGPQAKLVNAILGYQPLRRFLQGSLGLAADRPLPRFANERLSAWFTKRAPQAPSGITSGRVLLFNDTYLEHYQPQIGIAAIELLEAAGYGVELVSVGDSQRGAISQGDLDRAKRMGTELFKRLDQLGDGAPILVCEPSCASALADDLPDLIDDEALGQRVAGRVQMLDHFLEQQLSAGLCSLPFRAEATADCTEFLVHGHCHQKTLDGGRFTHRLLSRIPNAVVRDSESGCCGMAGAFGYETEHANFSRQIAAQRLLPIIAKAPASTWVVANGFSCRHQISDLSDRRPRHVAEIIRCFI